jgi:hypothetical protein
MIWKDEAVDLLLPAAQEVQAAEAKAQALKRRSGCANSPSIYHNPPSKEVPRPNCSSQLLLRCGNSSRRSAN